MLTFPSMTMSNLRPAQYRFGLNRQELLEQGVIMRIKRIIIAVMLVVVPTFAGVVEDSGIKGGLVVQVGCKYSKSLANLLVNRVFAIIDEAPNVSIRFMAEWKLVARDAFNGTLLWKRSIPT